MIPATPVPGTADDHPLVEITEYQRITADGATSDENVTASIDDALDMLQSEMHRTILYANYVERLYFYGNGMVYPSATPFDITKPVRNPNDLSASPPDVGLFQGNGIWVGWFVPLPFLPVWQGVVPPQTDVSYWGGWTGPAGPGPYLPASLKRVICQVAWYIANPVSLSGMPGGVKSVSVGGVSMSGDLSSMVTRDRMLANAIKRWRKPQAKAWDGQVTPASQP